MRLANIIVLSLALVVSWQQSSIDAFELYEIESKEGHHGDLKLTARKEFKLIGFDPDRVYYDIEIWSPEMKYITQELRIAIQWSWQTKNGGWNERVIFHALVGDSGFQNFEIDTNYDADGEFILSNSEAVAQQNSFQTALAGQGDKYQIEPETNEINALEGLAKFTFSVNREEPHGLEHALYLNWGIFNDYEDTSEQPISGPKDPYLYTIAYRYSDFYDKEYLLQLYSILFALSLGGILTLPFQLVPGLMVLWHVFARSWHVESSEESDQWDYLLEVGLRWQLGTVAILAATFSSNIISLVLGVLFGFFYVIVAALLAVSNWVAALVIGWPLLVVFVPYYLIASLVLDDDSLYLVFFLLIGAMSSVPYQLMMEIPLAGLTYLYLQMPF